jgi:hypothetical protein
MVDALKVDIVQWPVGTAPHKNGHKEYTMGRELWTGGWRQVHHATVPSSLQVKVAANMVLFIRTIILVRNFARVQL